MIGVADFCDDARVKVLVSAFILEPNTEDGMDIGRCFGGCGGVVIAGFAELSLLRILNCWRSVDTVPVITDSEDGSNECVFL